MPNPKKILDVPLSPVVTPGGNLLIYSGAQSEGQIWEMSTPGSESGEGEVDTTPTMIYDEHQFGDALNLEPPEEGAGPAMSFAPEKTTEGGSTSRFRASRTNRSPSRCITPNPRISPRR